MSNIRANIISAKDGISPVTLTKQWAAKGRWVYDQRTPIVRASENVSSITDNATGQSFVNLTNAMSAADYTTTFGGSYDDGGASNDVLPCGIDRRTQYASWSVSQIRQVMGAPSEHLIMGAVHGDLA